MSSAMNGAMNCPSRTEENRELLLDYVAGRLDATRTALFRQHMVDCADCAEFTSRQAMLWETLDAWEAGPVSLDFNRRLWQRIDAAENAPWYKQLADAVRFAAWKPVIPLTAAALLIAAGFLYDHPGSRNTNPAGNSAAVRMTDVEQVEQTLDDIQLLHQFDTRNE
jgi:anti-sigma factor RsiW